MTRVIDLTKEISDNRDPETTEFYIEDLNLKIVVNPKVLYINMLENCSDTSEINDMIDYLNSLL